MIRYRGGLAAGLVGRVNRCTVSLRSLPWVGRYVRRHIALLTYTGRRSGRTFTIPVGYRRTGDVVTIRVDIPERKLWWRNFRGDGGRLSLEMEGARREGRATARRDDRGHLVVTVHLDGPDSPEPGAAAGDSD